MSHSRTDAASSDSFESTFSKQPSVRNLSVAIWCGLALAAIIAYSRNVDGNTLAGDHHFIFGILIAAFAGAISLFAWAMSRQNPRTNESDFWKLLDGLCTLVPPAVIAVTILPVNSELRIWLLGSLLVCGGMLMVTMGELSLFSAAKPHRFYRKEYLYNERSSDSFFSALKIYQPTYKAGQKSSARNKNKTQPDSEGVIAMPRDGKVQHQIRRSKTRSGADQLDAKWRLKFQSGEKRATVHIPFSPVFESTPQVKFTVPPEANVTVKAAEIMPYGLRVEARRSQTAEAQNVVVGLQILAEAAASPVSERRSA